MTFERAAPLADDPKAPGRIDVSLPPDLAAVVRAQADRYVRNPRDFVLEVLARLAADDLFAAVLDEGVPA